MNKSRAKTKLADLAEGEYFIFSATSSRRFELLHHHDPFDGEAWSGVKGEFVPGWGDWPGKQSLPSSIEVCPVPAPVELPPLGEEHLLYQAVLDDALDYEDRQLDREEDSLYRAMLADDIIRE